MRSMSYSSSYVNIPSILDTSYNTITVLLILLLSVSACSEETDNTRKIGVIVAKTGKASFIGKPEAKVLDSLHSDYKKRGKMNGVELVIRDSKGSSSQAQAIFDEYANNDDIIAVIGPSRSGSSISVARKASEEEIPLLSLAASKNIVRTKGGQINKWAFKFAQNDGLAAQRLASAMKKRDVSDVAVLYAGSGFGKSGFEVFDAAASQANISILHSASYPPSLQSAETYIASIPNNVDALVIWGTSGANLLATTARQAGRSMQFYFSHGSATSSLIEKAGAAVEGSIVVGSKVLTKPEQLNTNSVRGKVILSYRKFWERRFQGEPSHFGGHAYDAYVAIEENLSNKIRSGPIQDARKELRKKIEFIDSLHGVTGTFDFSKKDHSGLTVESFETYKIVDGEFVPVTN